MSDDERKWLDVDLGKTRPNRDRKWSDEEESPDPEGPTREMKTPAEDPSESPTSPSEDTKTQPLGVHPSSEGAEGDEGGEVTQTQWEAARKLQDEDAGDKDVFDPVVGWLVSIEGGQRGQSFPLHSARNFVGRSDGMHVSISGDASISKDKHAIVTYDPKQNRFVLTQGPNTTQMVYLNGEGVYQPEPLSAHDVIEVGHTRLLFVPLCSDAFHWK